MISPVTEFDFPDRLRKCLLNNKKISDKVKGQVFPIIAKDGTKFPFIVYQKSNMMGVYNKDKITNYDIDIDIVIFADNYADMVYLEEAVNDCMHDDFNLYSNIQLTANSENFDSDTFYATLSYTFKL